MELLKNAIPRSPIVSTNLNVNQENRGRAATSVCDCVYISISMLPATDVLFSVVAVVVAEFLMCYANAVGSDDASS